MKKIFLIVLLIIFYSIVYSQGKYIVNFKKLKYDYTVTTDSNGYVILDTLSFEAEIKYSNNPKRELDYVYVLWAIKKDPCEAVSYIIKIPIDSIYKLDSQRPHTFSLVGSKVFKVGSKLIVKLSLRDVALPPNILFVGFRKFGRGKKKDKLFRGNFLSKRKALKLYFSSYYSIHGY